MSNYVNDLNDLITAKSEIKNIIQDTLNENPSEVFSYYPSYIARIAASAGGGSIDKDEINAYIAAYLSTYNYIDQDTLSYNSYITLADIPSIDLSSYITYSYADNKYFGRLAGIGGLSDGNVISSIGESFDAGASVRGLYYQKTYVPSYAYIESYYISKSELSSAGYLTSIPSEYITDSELSACGYLTQHQDLSSYVSKTELSNCGYITSIPSEYVTDSELSACGYITMSDVSACGYITSTDIPTPDMSAYVSKTELNNASYATTSQIPVINENLVSKSNKVYSLGDSSHLYNKLYTDTVQFNGEYDNSIKGSGNGSLLFNIKGTGELMLTGSSLYPYSKNGLDLGEWNRTFRHAYLSNIWTTINGQEYQNLADALANQSIDLSSYVSKTELSNMGYLTSIPSEYVTDSELSACGYLTSIPNEYASYTGVYSYLASLGIYKNGNYGLIDSVTISDSELSGDIYINGIHWPEFATYTAIQNMGYVTSTYVENHYLSLVDSGLGSDIGDVFDMCNWVKNNCTSYTYINGLLSGYYDMGEVDQEISSTISNYYTKTQINNASYTSKAQVNGMFSFDSTTNTLTITTL